MSAVTPIALTLDERPVLLAHLADRFWSRLCGLHAYGPLQSHQALIIRPCNAVQTLGMRYPIELAFLDRCGVILKLDALQPWRVSRCQAASMALEMASGTVCRLGLRTGQQLNKEGGTWI